jgi:hypothetical protein
MVYIVPPLFVAIVLLLVRAMLAIAFARESWVKFKDIRGFAKNDGVPVPAAWVVAVAELAAALSFASGILAQWAALGVIILMLITTAMHVLGVQGRPGIRPSTARARRRDRGVRSRRDRDPHAVHAVRRLRPRSRRDPNGLACGPAVGDEGRQAGGDPFRLLPRRGGPRPRMW